MQSFAISLLCVGTAVVYGVLHDQVTARVCVEYFTIGHPPVFGTDEPTLLGLGWGVIATWWAGLLVGIPLAVAAHFGKHRPKCGIRSLLSPIGYLFVGMAVCAFLAGVFGWVLSHLGVVVLMGPSAIAVPADKHSAFVADLWAHTASYLTGFVGGTVIVVSVWRSRAQMTASAADLSREQHT